MRQMPQDHLVKVAHGRSPYRENFPVWPGPDFFIHEAELLR